MAIERAKCPTCERSYMRHEAGPNSPAAQNCGAILCSAIDTWTPERWSDHARMADARSAAGEPLSPTDIEALARRTR